jgi:excisionase family DNA binding protein
MPMLETTDKIAKLPPDPRAFGLVKAAYSVNETLELLSIGRTTLYELVSGKQIRITKLGKKSLIYAIDIAALLQRLRVGEGCLANEHERSRQ